MDKSKLAFDESDGDLIVLNTITDEAGGDGGSMVTETSRRGRVWLLVLSPKRHHSPTEFTENDSITWTPPDQLRGIVKVSGYLPVYKGTR